MQDSRCSTLRVDPDTDDTETPLLFYGMHESTGEYVWVRAISTTTRNEGNEEVNKLGNRSGRKENSPFLQLKYYTGHVNLETSTAKFAKGATVTTYVQKKVDTLKFLKRTEDRIKVVVAFCSQQACDTAVRLLMKIMQEYIGIGRFLWESLKPAGLPYTVSLPLKHPNQEKKPKTRTVKRKSEDEEPMEPNKAIKVADRNPAGKSSVQNSEDVELKTASEMSDVEPFYMGSERNLWKGIQNMLIFKDVPLPESGWISFLMLEALQPGRFKNTPLPKRFLEEFDIF